MNLEEYKAIENKMSIVRPDLIEVAAEVAEVLEKEVPNEMKKRELVDFIDFCITEVGPEETKEDVGTAQPEASDTEGDESKSGESTEDTGTKAKGKKPAKKEKPKRPEVTAAEKKAKKHAENIAKAEAEVEESIEEFVEGVKKGGKHLLIVTARALKAGLAAHRENLRQADQSKGGGINLQEVESPHAIRRAEAQCASVLKTLGYNV